MFVNCFHNIKNPALKYVIEKYISKTPFLSTIQKITDETIAEIDLVILEADFLSEEKIKDYISQLNGKYLIILSDYKIEQKIWQNKDIIILPKNISHQEFIDGLSLLIDNKLSLKTNLN